MPTNADPGATQLLRDAERLHAEYDALLEDILHDGRYPTKDDERRIRGLRQDSAALLHVIEALLREQEVIELVVTERLGRAAIDGDDITEEDERRAAQIVEGWGL
jgi:L-fucose mutarotase/ribose pyranase (RbsD/FucU family)